MTDMNASASRSSGGKRRSAAWKGIAGVAIAIGGLAFAVRALVTGDASVSLNPQRPLLLALAVVLGLLAMGTIGANWWAILRSLDNPTGLRNVLTAYYPGQLGKYLPGGLWPIVGRGELLFRNGTPRSIAYTSVAISLMLTYVAAAIVAIPLGVSTVLASRSIGLQIAAGVVLLVATIIIVHPRVFITIEGLLSKLFQRRWDLQFPPWHVTIAIIATSTISWLLVGTTTWVVAAAYGLTPPLGGTISSTALSWLCGFLIIPVPGGIGVREAVFVATAPGLTGPDAALVAISSRVVFVVADLTGAGLAALIGFNGRSRFRSAEPL